MLKVPTMAGDLTTQPFDLQLKALNTEPPQLAQLASIDSTTSTIKLTPLYSTPLHSTKSGLGGLSFELQVRRSCVQIPASSNWVHEQDP